MNKHVFRIIVAIVLSASALLALSCLLSNASARPGASAKAASPTEKTRSVLPPGEWVIEGVDWGEFKELGLFSDRALRVDASGNPHIAYGSPILYYAWHDGDEWHYEVVDDSGEVGWYQALALGPDDKPYIVYTDWDTDRVLVAYRSETGWQTEVVDQYPSRSKDFSIAVDDSGGVHLSYDAKPGLVYAYDDGSGWITETVDICGEFSSLALDTAGRPHISYGEYYGKLKYASWTETGWVTETVDTTGSLCFFSLAVDSNDQPHISYRDFDNYRINYATYTATGWISHTVEVSAVNHPGYHTAIDLDDQERPHIVYNLENVGDLYHAYYDGNTWQREEIPGTDDATAAACSLVAEEDGDLHAAIIEWVTEETLRYFYNDGTGWQAQVVEGWHGGVGQYTSLELDGDDYPHVTYYDARPGYVERLAYRYQDADGWHTDNPIFTPDDTGKYTSLVLDDQGRPYVSGYDLDSGNLIWAWHTGFGWIEMTRLTFNVDDGWDTCIALDQDGDPYITFYDARFGDLYLMYRDGKENWLDTKLYGTDSDNVGRYSSIAFDSQNTYHVSFYDASNDALRYLKQGSAVQTLDSGPAVGEYTSLAVDSQDHPHVSYSCGERLCYARFDGANWITETVYSVGQFTSLALDVDDHPYISYYDQIMGDLRFTYYDGNNWHDELL
jgi:hypothetical protein